MLCTNCGAESGTGARFCPNCGQAVADTVSPATVATAQPVFPGETPPQSKELGNKLRIGFVLVWTAIRTFTFDGFSAEAAGKWVGILLVPLLLALLFARAWRKNSRTSFSYWLLGLSLLVLIESPHRSLTKIPPPELMMELMGDKPLEQDLPHDQVEMANAIRDFFKEAKTWRKGRDAEVALIAPDLAKLYSAESFSNRAEMQKTIDAAANLNKLDEETTRVIRQWPGSIKNRLDQTSLSDADKQRFMQHLMEGLRSSEFLTARETMTSIEQDWANSTGDLYGFAIVNASHITVDKGKVIISDESIRDVFNTKLRRAKGLRNDFLAAARKATDIWRSSLKQGGLSPEDIDLDE